METSSSKMQNLVNGFVGVGEKNLTTPLLCVLTVPPKLQKQTSGRQTLEVGQRVSLFCSLVDGDRPVVMSWNRDGVELAPSPGGGGGGGIDVSNVQHDSILRIDRLVPGHGGNYTCLARNAAGEASVSYYLLVKGRETML